MVGSTARPAGTVSPDATKVAARTVSARTVTWIDWPLRELKNPVDRYW